MSNKAAKLRQRAAYHALHLWGFFSDPVKQTWPGKRCRIFYALVILVTFGQSLFCDFAWIDHVEIEEAGYRVTSIEDLRLVFCTSLDQYLERRTGSDSTGGGYFRPAYSLSISADWALFGATPFWFHLENLLWHWLAVMLLHALGRQIIGRSEYSALLPFAITLLFAVHPINVHSVTWISGRKDLLCTAFAVAAIYCFGLASGLDGRTTKHGGRAAKLAPVLLLLAIYSKELAYVAPAFATVWWWSRRTEVKTVDEQKHGQQALISLWCVAAFAFLHRWWVLGTIGLDAGDRQSSMVATIHNASTLIAGYLARVIVPSKPSIVDRWPVSTELSGATWLLFGGLIIGSFVISYGIWRRKRAAVLASWGLIWLLPAMGLIPLRHLYAERYLYPASWGILMLIGFGLFRLDPPLWGTKVTNRPVRREWLLIVISLIFATQTLSANKHWKNDETLFSHAISQDPFYVEGHIGLASVALESEQYQVSLDHSTAATKSINDSSFQSYWSPFILQTNRGLAEYHLGNIDAAEDSFLLAENARPNSAVSQYHLGLIQLSKTNFRAAAARFEKARSLGASDFLTLSNLGFAFLRSEQPEKAVEILKPLVKQQPDNFLNVNNLGSAYLVLGKFAAAESIFEAAVKKFPSNAALLSKLALAELYLSKKDECRQHLEAAAKVNSRDPVLREVISVIESRGRE